jgi:MerR family redox-sensitive transcriptional activator SoxR
MDATPPIRHKPLEAILGIRDVVRRSGVAASAIRFYESLGLITAESRDRHGQRRYRRAVLRRLAFLVFAQRAGLTLEEAGAELARLPADRARRDDWALLAPAWTARIDQRIAELRLLRDSLTACIGCGCLSLDRCRLANPLDRATCLGPGPRYWMGDRPITAPGSARPNRRRRQ